MVATNNGQQTNNIWKTVGGFIALWIVVYGTLVFGLTAWKAANYTLSLVGG